MHCLERGHVKDVYPDLLDDEREVVLKPSKELDGRNTGGRTCRRCGSQYHLKNQIPRCNACHSYDHDGETNCPKNIYSIYKEKATHKTLRCPQRPAYSKYSSDHSTCHYKVQESRTMYSSRLVKDVNGKKGSAINEGNKDRNDREN